MIQYYLAFVIFPRYEITERYGRTKKIQNNCEFPNPTKTSRGERLIPKQCKKVQQYIFNFQKQISSFSRHPEKTKAISQSLDNI